MGEVMWEGEILYLRYIHEVRLRDCIREDEDFL